MPRVNLGKSPELRQRENELRERYGGFMSLTDISHEFGFKCRQSALKAVNDIPAYTMTGKKLYDIRDVAKLIEGSRAPAANCHGRP